MSNRTWWVTLKFAFKQASHSQEPMMNTSRLECNQPNHTTRPAYKNEVSTKTPQATASRRSFACRVIQLVFQRRQLNLEVRPETWPGCSEPLPPVPTASRCQSSANMFIPSSLNSLSEPPPEPVSRHVRARQERYRCDSEVHWRRRQAFCVNCERLFPTSLSTLSGSAGRFCSLDCKANFEYVDQLREVLDVEMLGLCGSSSCSSATDEVGYNESVCAAGAQQV